MKPATIKKIKSIKALQGKTLRDVCEMPKFREVLGGYIDSQMKMREVYIHTCFKAKIVPKAHTADRVTKNPAEFAAEFLLCIEGKSDLSAAEREYILQLGQQAYNTTICLFAVEEFPELKDELFPKAQ